MSEFGRNVSGRAVVLVARSAIAAQPLQELEELRAIAGGGAGDVTIAFTDHGEPSLRTVVHSLRDRGHQSVVLVPLLLPMEPAFVTFLSKEVLRWQRESPGSWPAIRVGQCRVAALSRCATCSTSSSPPPLQARLSRI